MHKIFIHLYQFIIQLYGFAIKLAALYHPKAKLWVKGRKRVFEKLDDYFKEENAPIIWMHCASVGEFEQGRPLIASLKKTYPTYKILLTFFSPSGYELRKAYPLVDFVSYLPLDSPKRAERFLSIVQPQFVFFVKYEFWYFYLAALQSKKIPYFLVAGVFRPNQLFFKSYGKWYLKVIEGFDHLFLQDESSMNIALQNGLKKMALVGDPRVDRVLYIAENKRAIPKIANFKKNKKLCVLGSTHLKDERLFFKFLDKYFEKKYAENWKFLLVPHEIDENHLKKIEKYCPIATERFSAIKNNPTNPIPLMILDTMGQLNNAYQYADMAYVGGGFDEGIHNILEPAVFGLPILIGPNYHKFKEARELVQLEIVLEHSNMEEFANNFKKLQNPVLIKKISRDCQAYLENNRGATQKIINYLINKNVI